MQLPSTRRHQAFPLPLLLLFITTSHGLTLLQFVEIFRSHIPFNGVGGCNRYENGVYMLPWALAATSDAFDMAATVGQQIDSYDVDSPSSKRLRNLLFLFFGVTFGDEYQLSPDSIQNYNYVKEAFDKVNRLRTAPMRNPFDRPWFSCLEDYAFFTEHLVGDDGLENQSAPLAAVYYDMRMPNSGPDGAYQSGLMYAPAIGMYYPSNPSTGRGGRCSITGAVDAFAIRGPGRGWGITLCPAAFNHPNFASLGPPVVNDENIDTIMQFRNAGGNIVLHEMFHVIDKNIIDQPEAIPPSGDYLSRQWSLWTLSATEIAYGFVESLYLGLARPNLGVLNADNYAIFALCVQYPILDCLGYYEVSIAKREEVPFQPAPKAVERIREDADLG